MQEEKDMQNSDEFTIVNHSDTDAQGAEDKAPQASPAGAFVPPQFTEDEEPSEESVESSGQEAAVEVSDQESESAPSELEEIAEPEAPVQARMEREELPNGRALNSDAAYTAPHSRDADDLNARIERIQKFFDENPERVVTVEELQDFFIKLHPKGFRFIENDDPTLLVLSILNLFSAKQRFAFEEFETLRAKNEAAYMASLRQGVTSAMGEATEHYYQGIDEKVRVLEEKLEGLTATLSATSTEAVEKNMQKFSSEMQGVMRGLLTAVSSTRTVFILGTFVISVFICSLIVAKFMGAL